MKVEKNYTEPLALMQAWLFLLIAVVLFSGCDSGPRGTLLQVTNITTELADNPMNIEKTAPRFGWELVSDANGARQTAYQVVVSHSASEDEAAVVWDSGKITSGQSQLIPYEGGPLINGERYFWKVKVWNEAGISSDWSNMAFFEMAPYELEKGAQWIGAITRAESGLPAGRNYHEPDMRREENKEKWSKVKPLAKRSIQLRKPFEVESEIEKATVYISGLGHYELKLNGEKVGNSEFAPLWSDYDKTVYYNAYDVTERLVSGENAIGVLLGNGMYNVSGDRYAKFLISFGPPTLFFHLKITYADGEEQLISSDDSWKWSESPITFNCVFGGEDYDATLEQDG